MVFRSFEYAALSVPRAQAPPSDQGAGTLCLCRAAGVHARAFERPALGATGVTLGLLHC